MDEQFWIMAEEGKGSIGAAGHDESIIRTTTGRHGRYRLT
jgi:hypothetical protein